MQVACARASTASTVHPLCSSTSHAQVLSLAGANQEHIRADPLQRMHTLHNLADILATKPAGIARTLRDDCLQKEAAAIADVRERPTPERTRSMG